MTAKTTRSLTAAGVAEPCCPDGARLLARIRELEAQHRQLGEDHVAVLAQFAHLAATSAALSQLHASTDRAAVLAAIQEIVVNFVGSEEFTLYVARSDGTLHEAAAWGQPSAHRHEPPVARVPLELDGRDYGLLVVHRLLEHRAPLTPLDRELLETLGRQAASALHVSSLCSARSGSPAA
jgi:hypothetical protein